MSNLKSFQKTSIPILKLYRAKELVSVCFSFHNTILLSLYEVNPVTYTLDNRTVI